MKLRVRLLCKFTIYCKSKCSALLNRLKTMHEQPVIPGHFLRICPWGGGGGAASKKKVPYYTECREMTDGC